jgi:TIR domain
MKRAGKGKRSAFTEVFLSHSSKDRKAAKHLAEMLRDHGVPVWYSETNLIGAQQWHDEIGAALSRCDWFIVLLSPSAVKSPWVKRELMYALRDLRYEGRILPVIHKPCDSSRLSWTLEDFQRIDLSADFEDGCRALLRTWGIGYNLPPNRAKAKATRE